MSAEKPIDHEQALSWLSAYLDGELPISDKVLLEAHLERCETCSAELEALRSLQSLVQELPEIEPPQDFADRVMRRIASEKSTGEPAVGRSMSLMPFLRRAAAVAAVVLIIRVGMHEWRNEPGEQAPAPQITEVQKAADADAEGAAQPHPKMPGAGGETDSLRKVHPRSGKARSEGAAYGLAPPTDSPVASRSQPSLHAASAPASPREAPGLRVTAELAESDEVNALVAPGRLDMAETQAIATGDDAAAAGRDPVRLAVRPHNRKGVEAVIAAFRVEGEGAPEVAAKGADSSVATFAFREQATEPGVVRFAVRGQEFARFLQELEAHAVVVMAVEPERLARDSDAGELRYRKESGLVMVEVALSADGRESDEN